MGVCAQRLLGKDSYNSAEVLVYVSAPSAVLLIAGSFIWEWPTMRTNLVQLLHSQVCTNCHACPCVFTACGTSVGKPLTTAPCVASSVVYCDCFGGLRANEWGEKWGWEWQITGPSRHHTVLCSLFPRRSARSRANNLFFSLINDSTCTLVFAFPLPCLFHVLLLNGAQPGAFFWAFFMSFLVNATSYVAIATTSSLTFKVGNWLWATQTCCLAGLLGA